MLFNWINPHPEKQRRQPEIIQNQDQVLPPGHQTYWHRKANFNVSTTSSEENQCRQTKNARASTESHMSRRQAGRFPDMGSAFTCWSSGFRRNWLGKSKCPSPRKKVACPGRNEVRELENSVKGSAFLPTWIYSNLTYTEPRKRVFLPACTSTISTYELNGSGCENWQTVRGTSTAGRALSLRVLGSARISITWEHVDM